MLFFYLSGLVAHLVPRLYPLTVYTTDIFLLGVNGLLLWLVFQRQGDRRLWWWVLLTYLGTFATEALGVATGRIFGEYSYGPTMQVQWLGVPLVIALNWTALTLAVNDLCRRWLKHPLWQSALSGLVIAGYDYFIEPVAIKLHYWTWAAGDIPLQNYGAWAVVAMLFSLPLNYIRIRYQSPILPIYLAIQLGYFLLLNALF